jgi:hypothetical protein
VLWIELLSTISGQLAAKNCKLLLPGTLRTVGEEQIPAETVPQNEFQMRTEQRKADR